MALIEDKLTFILRIKNNEMFRQVAFLSVLCVMSVLAVVNLWFYLPLIFCTCSALSLFYVANADKTRSSIGTPFLIAGCILSLPYLLGQAFLFCIWSFIKSVVVAFSIVGDLLIAMGNRILSASASVNESVSPGGSYSRAAPFCHMGGEQPEEILLRSRPEPVSHHSGVVTGVVVGRRLSSDKCETGMRVCKP